MVQQKADELLQEGIIQESHSPWNSPLFLVPKKDGSYRPVIDFRKVSALIVPDHYPLPVLSELLQSVGKHNTVFTSLDLLSGFWQIAMDDKSQEITAFPHLLITTSGFTFQWVSAMHLLPSEDGKYPLFWCYW